MFDQFSKCHASIIQLLEYLISEYVVHLTIFTIIGAKVGRKQTANLAFMSSLIQLLFE